MKGKGCYLVCSCVAVSMVLGGCGAGAVTENASVIQETESIVQTESVAQAENESTPEKKEVAVAQKEKPADAEGEMKIGKLVSIGETEIVVTLGEMPKPAEKEAPPEKPENDNKEKPEGDNEPPEKPDGKQPPKEKPAGDMGEEPELTYEDTDTTYTLSDNLTIKASGKDGETLTSSDLAQGDIVTLNFDGETVTSITKGIEMRKGGMDRKNSESPE